MTTSAAPLLVFMPGTGGMPERTSEFADLAAHQGYRVIGLEYTDTPEVAQLCPRNRDPKCSEKPRQERIYGDDVIGVIVRESILLRYTSSISEDWQNGFCPGLGNRRPKGLQASNPWPSARKPRRPSL